MEKENINIYNLPVNDLLDIAISAEDDTEDVNVDKIMDELSNSNILEKTGSLSEAEVDIIEDSIEDGPETFNPMTMYKNEIKKKKLLTQEELEMLYDKYKAGDKISFNKIVEGNLRLVLYHSFKFLNQGVEQLDLIQEGNLGLIKAVEKFDYTKGYKFTTYATWWIMQRMRKAVVNKNGIIRVPVYMMTRVKNTIKARAEFYDKHNREPSLEELSELTSYSIKTLKRVQDVPACNMSLDEHLGDDESGTVVDFIADEDDVAIEKVVENGFVSEQVNICLEQLTDREATVIKYYFGMVDGIRYSLQAIGDMMNPPLSRERIRQIKRDALEKLKLNARIKELTI